MYYIFVENEKLNGAGECPCDNEEIQNIEVEQSVYERYIEDIDRYIWNGSAIIENPDYEEVKATQREQKFKTEFFQTSLGWVRRTVTMADGTTKDFLSDLLPSISMALSFGQVPTIIAYNEPDYSEDVEDWTQYQHVESVNAQFVQECFLVLSNDFKPKEA